MRGLFILWPSEAWEWSGAFGTSLYERLATGGGGGGGANAPGGVIFDLTISETVEDQGIWTIPAEDVITISGGFVLNIQQPELHSGRRAQRLIQIPEYVVERFQPHRDAHHIGGHAGSELLFFIELPMRS